LQLPVGNLHDTEQSKGTNGCPRKNDGDSVDQALNTNGQRQICRTSFHLRTPGAETLGQEAAEMMTRLLGVAY
jgi:hypothetical protein